MPPRNCRPAPTVRALLLRATANGMGDVFRMPEGHNRYRVHVSPGADVSAGDVTLYELRWHPYKPSAQPLRAKVGTVGWSADGGILSGSLAPDGAVDLGCSVAGYAAAGGDDEIVAVVETWREADPE